MSLSRKKEKKDSFVYLYIWKSLYIFFLFKQIRQSSCYWIVSTFWIKRTLEFLNCCIRFFILFWIPSKSPYIKACIVPILQKRNISTCKKFLFIFYTKCNEEFTGCVATQGIYVFFFFHLYIHPALRMILTMVIAQASWPSIYKC